jgi:hypothetical protein
MKLVISVVNFSLSHGLNHLQFQSSLSETDAECGDVLYYTEVRRLSHGTLLISFLALWLRIEMLMNKKGKVVSKLTEENWFLYFALLCDINHHVNVLNTKLQRQQKRVSDMSGAAREFAMKPKLFRKQLENVNLCHFSSCVLLYKNGSVSVPFPSVRAVEMIDSLTDNFKMRFNDFRRHATNIGYVYLKTLSS